MKKGFLLATSRVICCSSLVLLYASSSLAQSLAQSDGLPVLPEQATPLPVAPAALPITSGVMADNSYVLGPGDRLLLNFFNVPEYDGERQVAIDGSLTLPLIGKLSIAGLTVEEGTRSIERAYAPYLRTPMVTMQLLAVRPIQIGVAGEINKPGAYEIPISGEGAAVEWPTVIEAIQLAGGITDKADVREVEIRRMQRAGGAQVIRVNLWEVLTTGNIQNDITLRYGDAITVPTSTALSPSELTQLAAANFSPDVIQVTVVGEVSAPGPVDIEPNAPLNQALLAAGGFDQRRADEDEVELIRLNPDGTVSRRVIPVAFDQGINDQTNPPLRNNDVVIVGRSGQAAFSDGASNVLGPFGAIFSPLRLLFDIFD